MADEVCVTFVRKAWELFSYFFFYLECVDYVAVEGDCEFVSVFCGCNWLCAFYEGFLVGFSRSGVSDVCDANIAW